MKKLNLILITCFIAIVAFIYFKPDTDQTNFDTKITLSPKQKQPYYIFFDLGQVLLKISTSSATKKLGVKNILRYTLKHKTPTEEDIQGRLFSYIDHCTQKPRSTTKIDGDSLPGVMCNWAKGEVSTKEMINEILNDPKKADQFFHSKAEKKLVLRVILRVLNHQNSIK